MSRDEALAIATNALGDKADRRRELAGEFDEDPCVAIDCFVLERLIEAARD